MSVDIGQVLSGVSEAAAYQMYRIDSQLHAIQQSTGGDGNHVGSTDQSRCVIFVWSLLFVCCSCYLGSICLWNGPTECFIFYEICEIHYLPNISCICEEEV